MTEYIISDVSAIEDAKVPMLPKPKKCFERSFQPSCAYPDQEEQA